VAFNAYGMLAPEGQDWPSSTGPDRFVVAVLGGSVADIFAHNGRDALQRALEELDPQRFRGRRVELVSLGTGGYKQPQQLFHLQYALLSGFRFDLVLNIDGFNELALAAENARRGIQPLYPSGYHVGLMAAAAGGGLDPDSAARLAELWALQRQELALLEALESGPLAQSALAGLLGSLGSRRARANADRLQFELAETAQAELDASYRGPAADPASDPLVVAADAWKLGSELVGAVAAQQRIPYVHVLQPNQYVPGSKPIGEAERRVAVDPANAWGQAAAAGYPLLRERGRALAAAGEHFLDLTMLFQDVAEPLYTDNCCHFGPRGNELLAEAVARAIAEFRPALGPGPVPPYNGGRGGPSPTPSPPAPGDPP
jgi:hypothetical protein